MNYFSCPALMSFSFSCSLPCLTLTYSLYISVLLMADKIWWWWWLQICCNVTLSLCLVRRCWTSACTSSSFFLYFISQQSVALKRLGQFSQFLGHAKSAFHNLQLVFEIIPLEITIGNYIHYCWFWLEVLPRSTESHSGSFRFFRCNNISKSFLKFSSDS